MLKFCVHACMESAASGLPDYDLTMTRHVTKWLFYKMQDVSCINDVIVARYYQDTFSYFLLLQMY